MHTAGGWAAHLLHLAEDDRALALQRLCAEVRVLQDVRQDVDGLGHVRLQHLLAKAQVIISVTETVSSGVRCTVTVQSGLVFM